MRKGGLRMADGKGKGGEGLGIGCRKRKLREGVVFLWFQEFL